VAREEAAKQTQAMTNPVNLVGDTSAIRLACGRSGQSSAATLVTEQWDGVRKESNMSRKKHRKKKPRTSIECTAGSIPSFAERPAITVLRPPYPSKHPVPRDYPKDTP